MRYQGEIEINVPREQVIDLFLDPDNIRQWQPDLVSHETLRGETGQPGASTRQVHLMGKSEVETIETVMEVEAPERFAAFYDSDTVWNLIDNHFMDIDGHSTRWIMKSDCRCSSALQQMMISLLRRSLKKQSMMLMTRFKSFAEASQSS